MLTNWKTVSQSIKALKKIEEQLADTEFGYNKKEKLVLERQKTKLEQTLGGIKNMGGYPDLVFLIDTHKESLAFAEATKLGIPIMAILDSNCNPDGVTFPIPGNDDSAKSIKLYCRLISDAAIAGIKENMVQSGIDISKLEDSNIAELKRPAAPAKFEERKPARKEFKKEDRSERKPERKFSEKKSEKTSEKSDVKKSDVKVVTKKPAAKKPVAKK